MLKSSRAVAALLLGASVVVLAAPAAADPTKKDDRYGYIFDDDILKAPQNGANTGNIVVMPRKERVRLMRPRVQFVTEMLKSVENM